MDRNIVRKIMEIAATESHQEGEWLFRAGDPANTFYILLKGRVMASPETEPA
jgi:CRP-like cAMP-binding protein